VTLSPEEKQGLAKDIRDRVDFLVWALEVHLQSTETRGAYWRQKRDELKESLERAKRDLERLEEEGD
jgi:hypothetical protein